MIRVSNTLQEDFNYISEANLPWHDMKDCSILITGATGLIGSLLIKTLYSIDKMFKLNLDMIALIRDEEGAKKLFHGYNIKFIKQDIKEPITNLTKIDYIIHCAAITKSKAMIENPIENLQTAIKGTENVLELTHRKQVKSIVYLSSMEVYGITDPNLESVKEEDLGFVDLKNPRNCYPEGKRICEMLCNLYYTQFGTPVKIARLAQTFGAGVSKNESRLFAEIARSVIKNENIVLNTDGTSMGNYCYTADTIKGIFYLLLLGENGETYNISNEKNTMTIKEMAELVAQKIANNRIFVVLNNSNKELAKMYAPKNKMKLSAAKIEKLGWKPKFNIIDMYKRMIDDWHEST